MHADIAILTVIPEELKWAKKTFGIVSDKDRRKAGSGTIYWHASVLSQIRKCKYDVVLTCIGHAGNYDCAAATSDVINEYKPKIVLLMGIAAGLRQKIKIGEVVLSERVVAYEPGVINTDVDGKEVFIPRPDMTRIEHTIEQDVANYLASIRLSRISRKFKSKALKGAYPFYAEGKEEEYRNHVATEPKIKYATMASGEKLLRHPDKLYVLYKSTHGRIEVGEMEAAGLVTACRRHALPWLVVRGISDFGDSFKNDTFHEFAAKMAAVTTRDFISHGLDLKTEPIDVNSEQELPHLPVGEAQYLNILTKLPEWMQENLGGYSPSYDEFVSGTVQVPSNESGRAISLLEDGNDLFIQGAPASGKTVFGLKLALSWNERTNGTSLFFDLNEHEGGDSRFVEQAKTDLSNTLLMNNNKLLLVLDNVHTHESIATRLLRFVETSRANGNDVQTLLLGRLKEGQYSGRRTLHDNDELQKMSLIGNEEAFICTARRLQLIANSEPSLDEHMATEWVDLCGSDLVVFAVSFNPFRPNELNRSTISKRAHENYIVPAENQPGGRDYFLTLCAFSAVDLSIEDQAVLGSSIEVLYPQFINDGILLRSTKQKRSNNPRLYCRLFHPSLGELILGQSTRFSRHHLKRTWLEHTLNVCQHYPFLLPALYYRLSTRAYERIITFEEWIKAVTQCDGLVERVFCSYPHDTIKVLRHGKLSWSWMRLRKLPDDEGYHMFFKELCRTHAHMVKAVLDFLDDTGLQEERVTLLNNLLENDVFGQSAAETSADGITTFLKYLCDNTERPQWTRFIKKLLGTPLFYQSVARTPANQIPSLLRYLDRIGYKKECTVVIQYLVENEGFRANLEQTPAGAIATFLVYVDRIITRQRTDRTRKQMEDSRDQMVRSLLRSEYLRNRMSAADDVVTLFLYTDKHDYRNETGDLVKFLSMSRRFLRSLAQAPADKIVIFLTYLDDQQLNEERIHILDRLRQSNEFWERVKITPVDKVVRLFEYLDSIGMEDEKKNRLSEFLGDATFKSSIARTEAADKVRFFKYLDTHGLKEKRNDILEELWDDREFMQSIRNTPQNKINCFLDYLDDIGMEGKKTEMLGKYWN